MRRTFLVTPVERAEALRLAEYETGILCLMRGIRSALTFCSIAFFGTGWSMPMGFGPLSFMAKARSTSLTTLGRLIHVARTRPPVVGVSIRFELMNPGR